jgi:hypothetical protein
LLMSPPKPADEAPWRCGYGMLLFMHRTAELCYQWGVVVKQTSIPMVDIHCIDELNVV